MAIRSGQGYRKDLNLRENPADADVWNNLYDAGIDNDLKVLRNNLRNTSVVGFSSINDGFFEFGIASDFVFTDDDHTKLNGMLVPMLQAFTLCNLIMVEL